MVTRDDAPRWHFVLVVGQVLGQGARVSGALAARRARLRAAMAAEQAGAWRAAVAEVALAILALTGVLVAR